MKDFNLEEQGKCTKCGCSSTDDPTVKLHRFPQPNKINKSRCELWAKFCFPNSEWQSPQFQNKGLDLVSSSTSWGVKMLTSEHKMLCDKHFKRTSSVEDNQQATSMSERGYQKASHGEEQDWNDNVVVVIKSEPDEEVISTEQSIETRKQLRKRKSKGSAEMDDSPKKSKDTIEVELEESSQDDLEDTGDDLFVNTSKYNQNDNCLIYGKLVTRKLRTYSAYERNIMMYKIDGLLIENPPGFEKSSNYSKRESTNKTASIVKCSKKKASSTSSTGELVCSKSEKSEGSLSKIKKVKKASPAHALSSTIEDSYLINTQVSSSAPLSPAKTNNFSNQTAKVTGLILNKPVKVTSSNHHPLKNSIQYQPVKVTSRIPNQPVKVNNTIPKQLVKVTTSVPNQPVKVQKISSQPTGQVISVPSHLPLQITIPDNKLASASMFVASSSYSKGKIVIMKSKSSKYVASSQPPILITVPSLTSVGHIPVSTQCDMNSLEQVSSIAATHLSQQYQSFQ